MPVPLFPTGEVPSTEEEIELFRTLSLSHLREALYSNGMRSLGAANNKQQVMANIASAMKSKQAQVCVHTVWGGVCVSEGRGRRRRGRRLEGGGGGFLKKNLL